MSKPVVLVTGACGGVGQALVQRFAASGWQVFATDLDDEALRRLDDSKRLAGYSAGDIRQPAECRRIVAREFRSPEHNHRCYRNKATSRYLISGMEGAEFLGLDGQDQSKHFRWKRLGMECHRQRLVCIAPL